MICRFLREWVSVLRQPSRETELCAAFDTDLTALRGCIADEARRLWENSAMGTFDVTVRPSTVREAGAGLFVEAGTVRPGEAVAFYPGTYFRDEDEWTGAGRTDASYVLNLNTHDGAPTGCLDAIGEPRREPRHSAHLVNHPPPDRWANVCPAAFRWIDVVPDTSVALNKTNLSAPAPAGALLVAVADARAGDELFLDYRLRRRATLADVILGRQGGFPTWYSPVRPPKLLHQNAAE